MISVASLSALMAPVPSSCPVSFCSLNRVGNKSTVLFVTAHPDDEAMFFMPSLRAFKEEGTSVHLLSLTIGGADGLGIQRTQELLAAADDLRVCATALNSRDFTDGFASAWDVEAAAAAITTHVRCSGVSFDTLVTFDAYGVSRHPNHRDTHLAAVIALRSHALRGVEALQLRTVAIPFVAGLEVLLLPLLIAKGRQIGGRRLFWQHSCTASWLGMRSHGSQWRPFRKAYVLLSRYSYLNELVPLTSSSQ